jgi:hypothetical protein
MRLLITSILALFTASANAAVGDVLGAWVETNGWQLRIHVSGMSTGGTYSLGLGSSNSIAKGAPKIRLITTSPGWDDSGATSIVSRSVFGTSPVYSPSTNEPQQFNETVNGTNVILTLALSDYVHPGESLSASVLSGLYTVGSTNSAVWSGSATNSSSQVFGKAIAKWTIPGYWIITNSTFQLRAQAYQRNGINGRPVRAVKFWCSDESGDAATNVVTSPSVDLSFGDAIPVADFIGTIDASGFTQGDVVTCNFIAYPWVGDSSAVRDSSAGTSPPHPDLGPLKLLCDRSGTYGRTVAVVDNTSGTDATGVAVDFASFNSGSPPAAFRNIGAAAVAIAGTNNALRSRNDTGGGIIYLRAGTNSFTGSSTTSAGTTPESWCEITTFPGDAMAVIANKGGSADIKDRVKLVGVKITATDSQTFTGIDALWFDQCVFDTTGSSVVYVIPTVFYTRCVMQTFSRGFNSFSTVNYAPALVRGNWVTNAGGIQPIYCATGNMLCATNTFGIATEEVGSTAPEGDNGILSYNFFGGYNSTATTMFYIAQNDFRTDLAIVGNVFESINNLTGPICWWAADSCTNYTTNILIWANTVIGQRVNMWYNDSGTLPIHHVLHSTKGNYFDDFNIKTYDFSTKNVARVGNLAQVYGVGFDGNVFGEIVGIGAPGAFLPKFVGLNTIANDEAETNWPAFLSDKSYRGSGIAPGLGNYGVLSSSPMLILSHDSPVPIGLGYGKRGQSSPSGAYTTANPRRSHGH